MESSCEPLNIQTFITYNNYTFNLNYSKTLLHDNIKHLLRHTINTINYLVCNLDILLIFIITTYVQCITVTIIVFIPFVVVIYTNKIIVFVNII